MEDNVYERQLEQLKDESKALRRKERQAAQALVEARARNANAEEVAALEKKAADALADLKQNIGRQQAVCEQRRLAEAQQQR